LEKGFYFFIDTLMYDTVNSHRIYSMVGSRWLKVDGLKNVISILKHPSKGSTRLRVNHLMNSMVGKSLLFVFSTSPRDQLACEIILSHCNEVHEHILLLDGFFSCYFFFKFSIEGKLY
jgi:hypothetical protein